MGSEMCIRDSAASGVILDSTAKNEYHENYLKAKSLLDLLK